MRPTRRELESENYRLRRLGEAAEQECERLVRFIEKMAEAHSEARQFLDDREGMGGT